MNKIESVVNKMVEKPYLLGMGAGKLSTLFHCSREEVQEAKHLARQLTTDTEPKKPELQLKSRWQNAAGQWLESYKTPKVEKHGLDVKPEEILKIIDEALKNKQPTICTWDYSPLVLNKGLNIWISDEHIGADTKDGLYDNEYDYEEIRRRFNTILDEIGKLVVSVGPFDAVNIGILGDTFDGWDGETTRGSHKLPQSLDNRKAFKVFMDVYLEFIDRLAHMTLANKIHFYFVANSNHGGDFDYIGYKTLELYINRMYPRVEVTIFEKFLNHFHYGCHTFIISHGKDQENRKYGLPLQINEQTRLFLSDYMKLNEMQPHVHVVKGDLHRSNLDLDRMCSSKSSFTYQNVASLFGASKWIMENFGSTMPICDYDIVSRDDYKVLRGHIYLQ